MTEKQWIELIAEDAQAAARLYGYLPSVLIAQTCQETGYGSTDLSKEGIYNVVGMKEELLNDTWTSMYWNGDVYGKYSPEWVNGVKISKFSTFRKYPSYFCGLADFCQFLHDCKRDDGSYKYRDLLGETDPYTLIEGVRSRGYCTDPNYSNAIMDIIEEHDLTAYDKEDTMPTYDIIDITSENTAPRSRGINPIDWIVIHYLGVPNADNPYLYGGGYGGHYNVIRVGKIYKVVDPRRGIVWHCGGGLQGDGGHAYHGICTNFNSIGIECSVCADTSAKDLSGDSDLWYFTEETQEACAWLVAQLMSEYDIDIDHVIRHYDVTGKICPNPYVLNNKRNTSWTWDEFKARVAEYASGSVEDPCEQFEGVRKIVANGQKAANEFLRGTGYEPLEIDGVYGPKTQKAGYAVLQRAMEYDYDIDIDVDGIVGSQTRGALDGHFIRYGERQWLVTYAEIACSLRGRDPNGIEKPGIFGDGLTAALGGVTYLDAAALIKLLE